MLNINTGINIPNDDALVSDEESLKDKNECTVVRMKPSKKQNNPKNKQTERPNNAKVNMTARKISKDEALVSDDECGEKNQSAGIQKPKDNSTKTITKKRNKSKEIKNKIAKYKGNSQKKAKERNSVLHKVQFRNRYMFKYHSGFLIIDLLSPLITNRYR